MNDNIIIKSISKTYFSIVSFFIFIFLIISISFIVLQNGLFIKEFSVSNIHIKQLYIKWNEKIDISLAEIAIKENKNAATATFDPFQVEKYFGSILATKEWFSSLIVKKITYGDIVGSFRYKIGESGFFRANSPTLSLDTTLDLSPQTLQLTINHFSDKKRQIELDGVLYFDTKIEMLYSDLHAQLSDVADFNIYTTVGEKQLYYKIKSNKKIKDLEYLINLAHLPHGIRYWAYDAIGMSYATLGDITGHIEYNDLKNAYKNVALKATLYDATYTYNKNLDAIHAKKIELEFKNGLFSIYPKEAYSYGMYLNKSWVLINFNAKKEILLTISLLFNAELNKSVLKILNAYKIKLPFLQNSGKVATDLKIDVGLETLSVKAKGKFHTKNSNFDYLGLKIDIADATINLNNYDVSIKNMLASYKDIANASVDVKYNAKKHRGKIDFQLNKLSLLGIKRETNAKPLHIRYNIIPKHNSITVEPSQWDYYGNRLSVKSLKLPLNFDTLDITIPETLITVQNIGDALLSGKVNVKTLLSNIDINIRNFQYNGLEMSHSNRLLHLYYRDKLEITSKNPIYFDINGLNYKLDKFSFKKDTNQLYFQHTLVTVGKYIKTDISANFNTETNRASISLNNFLLRNPNSNELLYKKDNILLSSQITKDKIQIDSKDLSADFTSQESGWRVNFTNIKQISKNSTFLQELNITDGNFTLFKNKNDKYTQIKAELIYPYKILLQGKIPTNHYIIKGKIYEKNLNININDKLNVTVQDDIQINLNSCPVNIYALLDTLTNFTKNKEKKNSKLLKINVTAKKSYIYLSKDRTILYDTLNLQYLNKILSAQLHHTKGSAFFQLRDGKFHLYGNNFNDDFMNHLFSRSDFSKGSLNFSFNGKLHEYKGIMQVKKTTIRKYVVLNNILAFVNTIPSLVTFSLPGYNKNGLYVKNAIVHFISKKNFFTIKDIYLNSKEMKIKGKGSVDFNKKRMDITLNLNSDLGSSFAKVPVLGYILLGEDTLSTALKITGDIKDPEVTPLIAKDIIVAPINILKRTLLLPYKYIYKVFDRNTSKKK